MTNDNDITTLPLRVGTHESLKRYGIKGQTWDNILKVLMEKSDTVDGLTEEITKYDANKTDAKEFIVILKHFVHLRNEKLKNEVN